MILIIDEFGLKRSEMLRRSILDDGLPAVLATEDNAGKFPEAAVAFVFTPSEHHLNKVALRCKRIPILAYNSSDSRIYNSDVLFYDPESGMSEKEFIYGFLRERYGIDVASPETGESALEDRFLRVGMTRIKLTHTERRIMALFMMLKDRWVSENSIHRSVFPSTGGKHGRVAVHICNINSKAKEASVGTVIETRRNAGYRLAGFL